jgi:autotransporter-associated beta strand protein
MIQTNHNPQERLMSLAQLIILIVSLALLPMMPVRAATGTWTATTSGNWSDTTKWGSGTVADGAGSSASFTANLTAAASVTNDTPGRIIGSITLADSTATFFGWTLTGPNSLSLQTGTGVPSITVNNAASSILCPLDGTQGFVKSGTQTLNLGTNNTISGILTNTAGTINFTSGSSPNLTGIQVVAGASINIQSSALVATTGGDVAIAPTAATASTCSVSAGGTLIVGAGGTLQLGNNTANGSANQTLNVAGVVTNNGSLYVGRPGILNLNSGSVWAQNGGMSVNGQGGFPSTMNVNSGAAFSYAGSSTIKLEPASANAGAARLSIAGGTFTTAQGFERTVPASSGYGGVILQSGGKLVLAANIAQFTVGSVVISNHTGGGIFDTAGFSTAIAAPIHGNTGASFTKNGAGILTFAAMNDYSGATVVNAGTLQLGDGASNLGSVAGNIQAEASLVFANPFNLSYNGVISSTSGLGTVTKQAAGTLTLNGGSTYSGATTVNGGKLYVDGSLNTSSPISVAAGATLGGSGSVGNVSVASGGTVEGGDNGSGTLTVNNLAFSSGGSISVSVNPTTPAIQVNNTLTTGSSTPITVLVQNTPAPNTTNHILYFTTLAGAAGFQLPPSRAYSLQTNGNYLDLVVSPFFDLPLWTGSANSEWSLNAIPGSKNWKLLTAGTPTDFISSDSVVFDDSSANPVVNVSATTVNPIQITFSNSAAGYILQGSKSITSGSLNKNGTASLTLASTNSFPGAVALNGGTTTVPSVANSGVNSPFGAGTSVSFNGASLAVASASSMNRGVTVNAGGATLEVNNPLQLSGSIDGVGALTKNGTNTLTLSSANSYAGGTTLNAGRLNAGNSAAFGSGPVTVNAGTLSSDSATARDLANSFVFNGAFTLSDSNVPAAMSLGSGAGATVTLVASSTVNLPTPLGVESKINAPIHDGGAGYVLTKTGHGYLTLNSTASDWAGGVDLQQGVLHGGGAIGLGCFGTGPVNVHSGAEVLLSTFPAAYANAFTLAGVGPATGQSGLSEGTNHDGALRLHNTATITAAGSITLADNTRITGDVNGPVIAAPIGESGGARVLEIGGSDAVSATTLTLSGVNSYSGGTTIVNGRALANNVSAFGFGPVNAVLTGEAYLNVAAGDFTNTFNLTGNGWTEAAGQLGALRLGSGTLVSGPINLTTNSRVTSYSSTGYISGSIAETNGSWKLEIGGSGLAASAGTTTLSGSNSYSGGTDIRGGICVAANNNAFGTGPVLLDEGAAVGFVTMLEIQNGVTITNAITLDSTAQTASSGAIYAIGGGVSALTGPITITTNTGNGGHFAADAAPSTLQLLGPILTPTGIVPVSRAGIVEVGGGGSYTQFNVGQGTLRLLANNGLNPASGLALGLSAASTFDLNGFTQTLTGLTGTTNDVILNGGASPGTLTVNTSVTNAFNGAIQDGAGTVSLVKQGSGILLLNGTNTFTGTTLVSGGTLGGTGVLSGPVTVQSGATLAPGAPTGALTVNNNVTLNAGSTMLLDVNGTTGATAELITTGTLAFGGTLTVVNLGGSVTNGQTFQLFAAASHTGNFNATNLPALPTGYGWNWNPGAGTLTAVQTVATNPTKLNAFLSGSSLNLSWPTDHTGWRLLAQTNSRNLGNPSTWFTWPGSATTNFMAVPVNTTNPSVFFRLVYP